MSLIKPENYKSKLSLKDTQIAIKMTKDFFEANLAKELNLVRVSAPLFVDPETGLNDNLNGVENVTLNMKQSNLENISKHIQMAIDYINDNYNKKLSLEDISSHINLSVVHTSRLFKKETGKTVLNYINEVKLAKAKQMLDTGKYKIYEVAEELDFNNYHYFSTMFRKFTGLTPREYLQNKNISEE